MKNVNKPKIKKELNLKTWLIPRLRRLSYQWPNRNIAKANSRIERGKYKCAHCSNIFGPKEISMDHIHPVVPIEGFQDLGTYVEALFCSVDNYQSLCSNCHDTKTLAENEQRTLIKQKNKENT